MQQVFLSVGSKLAPHHEQFVDALERRLRTEGLEPRTLGRNYYSVDAPFIAMNKLMNDSSGVVVVALERTYFERGFERRGSNAEAALDDVRYCTPWNQIEATLAFARNLPLFVIVEDGVKQEGMLEANKGWYVLTVPAEPDRLKTDEFNGVLASWREKVETAQVGGMLKDVPNTDLSALTILQLIGMLRPGQFKAAVAATAGALIGAFTLGALIP